MYSVHKQIYFELMEFCTDRTVLLW